MVSTASSTERVSQDRAIGVLKGLGYRYQGWLDKSANQPIQVATLRANLIERGYSEGVADKAIEKLLKIAYDRTKSRYVRNNEFHQALTYGVKVKVDTFGKKVTVFPIELDPAKIRTNDFSVAEEVSVAASNPDGGNKRPDIVIYVNGIVLAIIELKRAYVDSVEAIRQHLDNQDPKFIPDFYVTAFLLLAGNDSQGVFYGTNGTPEKFWVRWREENDKNPIKNRLDRGLTYMLRPHRMLELLIDFTLFDGGIKKVARPHQYFGVKEAQKKIARNEGGIMWHTQGSGKTLTMVLLVKWLKRTFPDARITVVSDREELDAQNEKVFKAAGEKPVRTSSGRDLIDKLRDAKNTLICSLIHKFGRAGADDESEMSGEEIDAYIAELAEAAGGNAIPGRHFVFVDECHRTQSGKLHQAMKAIMPNAVFIGFTGTPLLKKDKPTTERVFGGYIHTYKYDQALKDGVVLPLRYEARDVSQYLSSPTKIDAWFEKTTAGLNETARARLRTTWANLRRLFTSKSRLEAIVADIVMDFQTVPRLASGRGNAMLAASSIHDACRYWEILQDTPLAGHVGLVTSYVPDLSKDKGESTGHGETDNARKNRIYRQVLVKFFGVGEKEAVARADDYATKAKEMFIDQPAEMKLMIVVNRLLTGTDAPNATYIYLDKEMQDHNLFQSMTRVNRIGDADKQYGVIVDYRDMFQSIKNAVNSFTGDDGAFAGYDPEDLEGVFATDLSAASATLNAARLLVNGMTNGMTGNTLEDFLEHFSPDEDDLVEQSRLTDLRRLFYQAVSTYARAYVAIANRMSEAGYSEATAAKIAAEVKMFVDTVESLKVSSGDNRDFKAQEPEMRWLIDNYIKADDAKAVATFDDQAFLDLFVSSPDDAVAALPATINGLEHNVAATIAGNIRRDIIERAASNPTLYKELSDALQDALREYRNESLTYQQYLKQMQEIAAAARGTNSSDRYPEAVISRAQRALYDFFDQKEDVALAVDRAMEQRKDEWRTNVMKKKRLTMSINEALRQAPHAELPDGLMDLLTAQNEY
jgi:type I restriction enzyme R subunit